MEIRERREERLIKAVRRRNLEIIISEMGGVTAVAAKMAAVLGAEDLEAAAKNYANTIYQMRGKKAIGDEFAHSLEVSMGKPENWMDRIHATEVDIEATEAAQILTQMHKDGRDDERNAIMQVIRASGARGPKASAANPFPRVPKGGGKEGTQ